MTAPNRLRRSCLSVPGGNERLLAKAPTIEVDMAFVDLEDSVPVAEKNDATRLRVAAALTEREWRATTLAVRINPTATEWCGRDVSLLLEHAGNRVDCIVVPKVESAREVEMLGGLLSQLEGRLGLERRIGLEAQIESARGLVDVERIAAASRRLETLVFGPGDFAASLGVPQRSIGEIDPAYPGDQWHYARSHIAVAAHANGLQPIDGPYAKVHDLEGLRESARRARLLGFEGKWVIHPDQIAVCDEVFSPDESEIARARGIVDALRRAAANGHGAVLYDGAMIDGASARLAESVLARARAAGMEVW